MKILEFKSSGIGIIAEFHRIPSEFPNQAGVRPLRVGEVWMRLWSDCSHAKTKVEATSACGDLHLCAGLHSGIKANLHAVRAILPQSAGWMEDGNSTEEQEGTCSTLQ